MMVIFYGEMAKIPGRSFHSHFHFQVFFVLMSHASEEGQLSPLLCPPLHISYNDDGDYDINDNVGR